MGATRAIDWATAQRVGELIAGSPPYGGAYDGSAQGLAHEFARRVGDHTGLELPAELPPLEMVDRPGWIAANLLTMRPLLDPLVARLSDTNKRESSDARPPPNGPNGAEGEGRGGSRPRTDRDEGAHGPGGIAGLLSGPLRAVSGPLNVASDHLSSAYGHLLGAQLGAVTGMLSQRVLGQYDVSLLDANVPPRLLLLAPNLSGAARTLGVDRDELIVWVTIHEITHAVQFSGAPWLREHLGSMLGELIDGLQVGIFGATDGDSHEAGSNPDSSSSSWLPDPRALLDRVREGDLGETIERARHGELLRIGLGDERWALVERMQATMSLIEGHAEHTMDAVGADVLPSLPRLRAAMTRRREQRTLPWRVLERVLGLELKMRQYEVGRSFCDAVVETGGPELLALAWRSPEELPSSEELAEPARWIERMRVAA